jgi:hypothetical protein
MGRSNIFYARDLYFLHIEWDIFLLHSSGELNYVTG